MKFAIIATGGKQYRVQEGQTLSVEKLQEQGSTVFSEVLLFADGSKVTVGTPLVTGATVKATILGNEQGPKVVIQKYKAKVRYRRKTGHRQTYTKIRIDSIAG